MLILYVNKRFKEREETVEMSNGLILGTTRIGDLRLNNTITKTDNGNPIDNIRLTIPE